MKTYRFDYLREWVDKWVDKTHITMSQLLCLPDDILLPWFMPGEEYRPAKDHYGDDILDISEWRRQKNEYIEKLWVEFGSYVDTSFDDYEWKNGWFIKKEK